MEFIHPRARQQRYLDRLADEARQDRLARIFAELERRKDPAVGASLDEDPELQFAEYISDR